MGEKSLPPPWFTVLWTSLVCPCLKKELSASALLSQEASGMFLVRKIVCVVLGTGICSFPARGARTVGQPGAAGIVMAFGHLSCTSRGFWDIFSFALKAAVLGDVISKMMWLEVETEVGKTNTWCSTFKKYSQHKTCWVCACFQKLPIAEKSNLCKDKFRSVWVTQTN